MRCKNSSDLSVEEVLYAWGAWSRSGVFPKSPQSAVAPPSSADKDDPIPISMELAEKVDAAMLALKVDEPDVAEVMLSRYLYGNFNDKEVGRRLHVNERTVRRRREVGHAYFKGWLMAR